MKQSAIVWVAACVAMWCLFGHGALADTDDPIIPVGRVCSQGCDNGTGCSWFTNTCTRWYPHVECRYVAFACGVHCVNSQQNLLCYEQWRYEGYGGDCTGHVVEYRQHYTPGCTPL